MITIRLARIGKKNKPMYRLIISEKKRDLYGKALEILGSYNPHNKELQAANDRIKYWLEKGATMSPTVNNLLIEKSIITGKKVKASKPGKAKQESKEPAKPAEAKVEKTPADTTPAQTTVEKTSEPAIEPGAEAEKE